MPDHLTFLAELNEVLRDREGASMVGVVLVSLECIAHIDGTLGYRAGDVLCCEISTLLAQALRPEDRVFRISRDELACILKRLPSEGHTILAAHKIVRTLNIRFRLDNDNEIHVSPFVGISLGSPGAQDADNLLRQANVASQEARRKLERFFVFDARLDEPRLRQMQLQSALRDAISRNLLELHFQPKLDLRSGLIAGAEVLARWTHPTTGSVPPAHFIPVAEASGLISALTLRVLNGALRRYDEMQTVSGDIKLAVNLSSQDLLNQDLPDVIAQTLSTWNVPPEKLTLELTETAVMDDWVICLPSLERLRETGIRLSIDDFGTGYSSMTRLRNLPVDELKLDISFVSGMLTSRMDDRIVNATINLAHDFGIEVVAEGVENEATLLRLQELGCDLIQGYFVSKPLPAEAFLEFIASYTR